MKTIVTMTMNPAIDKSSSVAHVVAERKLYCRPPRLEPGGGEEFNPKRLKNTCFTLLIHSYQAANLNILWGFSKFEIRIPKLETNSNDQNTNDQNNPAWFKFVLDFGHCSFDIVSDFACLAEAFTRRWVLRISVSPGSGLNWKLNSMI
jgi:hypothetical protein